MTRLETRLKTKEKRKTQDCKVYELKIDKSKLSRHSLEHLKLLFLEGKWLYNSILSSLDIKNYDTKIKEVSVKIKDTFEIRKLSHISSQMKQAIKNRTFQNILNLSKAKKVGLKIGRLKFKSYVNCIPLNQNNMTHKIIKTSNSVKIQGFKKPFKVRGLKQIPNDSEIANANLVKKGTDYYFHITTYSNKISKLIPNESIGIDFGCETQLTLSNGIKLKYEIPVPKRLKRLDRKIMKKNRKRSNNKLKDQLKRRKLYNKLNNKKQDIKNKIVSCLVNNYKYVVFQDESIKAWQAGRHGKKIQNTAIGGIISDLKNKSHTPIMVDKFFPSTQLCPNCGTKNKLPVWERTYSCKCGYTEDRDVKSAQCIETEGLKNYILTNSKCKLPTERRDIKPRETEASVSTIFSTLENIVDVSFVETLNY